MSEDRGLFGLRWLIRGNIVESARLTALLGALAAVCAALASLLTNEATAEGGQTISALAIRVRHPSTCTFSFHSAFRLFLAFSDECKR